MFYSQKIYLVFTLSWRFQILYMVTSLHNTPFMAAYSAAKSISCNNNNLHIMNGYEDERNELIACVMHWPPAPTSLSW